jgi:hypothetical protein
VKGNLEPICRRRPEPRSKSVTHGFTRSLLRQGTVFKLCLVSLLAFMFSGCVTVKSGKTYIEEKRVSTERKEIRMEARMVANAKVVSSGQDSAIQAKASIHGYCVNKDYDVYQVDTYRKQTIDGHWYGYLGAGALLGLGVELQDDAEVAIGLGLAGLGLLGYTVVQGFRAIDDRIDRDKDRRLNRTSSLFKCQDLPPVRTHFNVKLDGLSKDFHPKTNSSFKVPVAKMWSCRELLNAGVGPNSQFVMKFEAKEIDKLKPLKSRSLPAKTFVSACYAALHQTATKKKDRKTLRKLTDLLTRKGGDKRLLSKAQLSYDDQLYQVAMRSKEVSAQKDYLKNCQVCAAKQKKRIVKRRDKFLARDHYDNFRKKIRTRKLSDSSKSSLRFAFLRDCHGLPCKGTAKAAKKQIQMHRKDEGELQRLLAVYAKGKQSGDKWCKKGIKTKTLKAIEKIKRQEEKERIREEKESIREEKQIARQERKARKRKEQQERREQARIMRRCPGLSVYCRDRYHTRWDGGGRLLTPFIECKVKNKRSRPRDVSIRWHLTDNPKYPQNGLVEVWVKPYDAVTKSVDPNLTGRYGRVYKTFSYKVESCR